MTEKFNKTGKHKVDHTTFGGLIRLSDFNTDYRGNDNKHGSSIASRIISDQRFDEHCKKNRENNIKRGEENNA